MEPLKVNSAVVAATRQPLSKIGREFGGMYFNAAREACDRDHAKKVMASKANHDLDLVLNRSLSRYKMGANDIIAVEVGEDAEGNSNVYINRGRKINIGGKELSTEVVIPIDAHSQFSSDPTSENLKKALDGDRSIIFADPDSICTELNRLNNNEILKAKAMIQDLEGNIRLLESTIKSNNEKAAKYKQEMASEGATDLQVNVHVNQVGEE